MSSSKTKPGTPKLSEVARKVAAPTGIVSTMWPAVEHTCRTKLGLTFDPWQNQAGRLALAKRADGTMAATIDGVGMSICRQAGKTHWMTGLIFGLSINRPGTLTVWSAHHARTHGETFLSMLAFAERLRVAPYIEQTFTGAGTEEIRFRNGSRVLFGARERGFGRGIPGVDIIVADEAQIMSENAVDAMTATMNTSKFGLAFYIGTPPKPTDPSEAFTRMRDAAWAGTLTDGVWIEFGVEPGVNPDSPDTWKAANPSYPHRTPRESMLRLKRKLSPESFLREGLGIWLDEAADEVVFDLDRFGDLVNREPQLTGSIALAVDRSLDGSTWALGSAQATAEGRTHVEIGYFGRATLDSMVAMIVLVVAEWDPVVLVIDRKSGANVLQQLLINQGIEPEITNAPQMASACLGFEDDADAEQLSHTGQECIDDALRTAEKRYMPQGDFAWDKKVGPDAVPLTTMSLARWGLLTFGLGPKQAPVAPPDFGESDSADSGFDVFEASF
ncbi:terminase [Williamsia sp. DF01-3]|uniref:terminase n=1 Tax=Williamsia sp. DF01-3 TaxID=2934157 RepID=UPI001FF49AE0|nr:terminase [Williamsia sp. DF01-3]